MSKRILTCAVCKGSGVTEHEELTNYHKRDYASWTEECKGCKGSGRMLETTSVKLEPYVPPKPDPTRR